MAYSKASMKAVDKYVKNNYDSILIRVPKGRKTTIEACANATGERRDRNDGTFYGGGVDQMTPPQPRVSEANFEEVAAEDDLPF